MTNDPAAEWQAGYEAGVEAAAKALEAIANCSMGVGCDEMGICYANANGKPENCPKQSGDNLKGLHNDQNFNMCDPTC